MPDLLGGGPVGFLSGAYDATLGKVGSGLRRGLFPDRADNEFRQVDPSGDLSRESGIAGRFAGQSRLSAQALGREARQDRQLLRDRAEGRNLVSAEMLRQGLQQNMAGQQSMAAGAAPGSGAMAARTAMNNVGRMGAASSGQAALAGMQEAQAAQNLLGQQTLQQRGQDLNAALGSQGQALQGYGAIEDARTNRFGAMMNTPKPQEQFLGALQGFGALAASDKRLKKDIKSGDRDADEFLKALKSYRYSYKDSKHGEGEQLGLMAQDLLKTKHGKQAVIETDGGLMVNGAKLAGALAATLPGLDKRLSKLERKK